MIVVTAENVADHRTVQTLGQGAGVIMRSHGLGGDLIAGVRKPSSAAKFTDTPNCSRRRAATRSTDLSRTQPRWEPTPC